MRVLLTITGSFLKLSVSEFQYVNRESLTLLEAGFGLNTRRHATGTLKGGL